MGKGEVSLERRRKNYSEAERRAEEVSERYVEARAGGRLTQKVEEDMDHAQAELRRAKRRLEDTQRRLRRHRPNGGTQ